MKADTCVTSIYCDFRGCGGVKSAPVHSLSSQLGGHPFAPATLDLHSVAAAERYRQNAGRHIKEEEDRTNPKAALGTTKPMLGLNPPVALLHMAKAFEFGAHGRDALGVQVRPKGYGEFNWRNTDIAEMVYVHAMQRHMADYLDGEDIASDSKAKHLGHIMACCAILLDAEECGTLVRDRPPKGKAGDLIERMTIKKAATSPAFDDVTPVYFDGATLSSVENAFFARELEEITAKMYEVYYNEFPKRKRRQTPSRQGQKPGRKPRRGSARK